MKTTLKEKISTLPTLPGVYIMKNREDRIIYIGKAVNLKARVSSYFASSPDSAKTALLVSKIADFEYIATQSEREALLLEANLIKKEQPRFNIKLKDSSKYPYICITEGEDFPRIFKTRNTPETGNRYFGPYPSGSVIIHTIKLLHRLFPIRYCRRRLEDGKKNGAVCFYYHINRCTGPCETHVTSQQYKEQIQRAILFLEGKHESLIQDLTKKMQNYSASLEFEKAAILRDQINAVQSAAEFQVIHQLNKNPLTANMDVVSLHEAMGMAVFAVLQFRQGKLQGQRLFVEKKAELKPDLFAQFLAAYYNNEKKPPKTLLLPHSAQLLKKATLPEITILDKGSKKCTPPMKRALAHARANARLALDDEIRIRFFDEGLKELQKILKLHSIPRHIEGFDIATLLGEETVAGMVYFSDGRAQKSKHRHYIIKSIEGQDDFGSMREAVARRYQRLLNDQQELPDLILIDGGRGQLNAALESLTALGLNSQPVAALAKKEELIFLPNKKEPLRLDHHHFALRILQSVRDEAHRNVNSFHIKRRDKKRKKSKLEDIPGIGPATRGKLLRHFGSIEQISQANETTLIEVIGNKKQAQAIIAFFTSSKDGTHP